MYYFLAEPDLENSICSRGLGEVSSAECFSDIPAYVLSRLNLTAEKSCCNASGMESCQSSPFGMTLQRSTGSRGPDSLMWFAGDSPVRTYLPPEKEQVFGASEAGCGPSSPGSLARYNPNLYGWKTAQCSLFGGLEWFSETFPRWGMMRGGELFPLPTPEHLTLERESGYLGIGAMIGGSLTPKRMPTWLTPRASDAMGGERSETFVKRNGDRGDHCFQSLASQVTKFPTPTKSIAEGSTWGANRKSDLRNAARNGGQHQQQTTPITSQDNQGNFNL